MRIKQVRHGLSETRNPCRRWILACSHVSVLRVNHFIPLNQLNEWLQNLTRANMVATRGFIQFFSRFLDHSSATKASYERNDIVILFSFWQRMMLFRDTYENQNTSFLLKIVFSPNSAFYLKDNKRVNMIQYISILLVK